jgi:hypothetical protein
VEPGHDAVLALGGSGEPIVVRAEAAAPQRPVSGAGRNRAGRSQGRRPGRRPSRPTDRGTSAPAA